MRIYQLQTAKDFYESLQKEHSLEVIMHLYAEHVATKFAAECVNEALGNKMEVSNALHEEIEKRYRSIEWEQS